MSSTAGAQPVRTLIRRPPFEVHLDDTLRGLSEAFAEEYVGAAVVKATHPPALVSERDVIAAIAGGADPDQTRVSEVMSDDLVIAGPADRISDVAARMLADEIRHVPIVEDDVVIGVVSVRDVLGVFVE